MITVVCWKWKKDDYRSKFESWHVDVLRDMVRRNTSVPHRFVCITDDASGIFDPSVEIIPLWANPAPNYGSHMRPNCFVRLPAFSSEMKSLLGEKFIWLDLDTVITGNIDHILSDEADFKIWKVDGETMPCNGSMVMMRTGARREIWERFSPTLVDPHNAFRKSTGLCGSDQAWIAQNLSDEDQFFGQKDGVYSFRCHLKPTGQLVPNAKIVFFHGNEDPWDREVQKRYPWIREHYRVKHERISNGTN